MAIKEAIKKANELEGNYGLCEERTDVFLFPSDAEDFGPAPLIILKSNGQDVDYTEWLSVRGDSKYVKSHKFEDGQWHEFIDEACIAADKDREEFKKFMESQQA